MAIGIFVDPPRFYFFSVASQKRGGYLDVSKSEKKYLLEGSPLAFFERVFAYGPNYRHIRVVISSFILCASRHDGLSFRQFRERLAIGTKVQLPQAGVQAHRRQDNEACKLAADELFFVGHVVHKLFESARAGEHVEDAAQSVLTKVVSGKVELL